MRYESMPSAPRRRERRRENEPRRSGPGLGRARPLRQCSADSQNCSGQFDDALTTSKKGRNATPGGEHPSREHAPERFLESRVRVRRDAWAVSTKRKRPPMETLITSTYGNVERRGLQPRDLALQVLDRGERRVQADGSWTISPRPIFPSAVDGRTQRRVELSTYSRSYDPPTGR